MTENESKAFAIGNNPKLLQKRLNDAKVVLTTEARGLFSHGKFDFNTKSLLSNDGKYKLQWALRLFPGRPESYENQQTSIGTVTFRAAR